MNEAFTPTPWWKASWFCTTVTLLVGAVIAYQIVSSAPKPKRVKPEVQPRLVDVVSLAEETSRPMWTTGGVVSAADAVSLMPQVSGRVEWINPQAVPGAQLEQGIVLARLEQADFRLQVTQAEAALTQAKADLAVELGQGKLAQEEYAIAASQLTDEERALVLRKPQRAAAEAAVAVAEASLRQARLDLARSEVRMPFAGRISSRNVSVGSYASASTVMFDLVGTSKVWIDVTVPRTFLNWIDSEGTAQISMPGWQSVTRQAQVLNILPSVADSDRQARVVLELNEPLQAGVPPVLVNDFVDVVLPGREITSAVIESRMLNDDGSVWVVNDNKLYRRQPQIIFQGREKIWLGAGFERGDELLMNRIDSATSGTPVRVRRAENGQ
jgi:RND family efflux transporter MFP subunit